ncbi:MAG: helix-turn-helix transcriptional regulator [Bifidobacterium breve]|nr:helix-turn-helix transcriptional regulator [Clostridium paraputrificum]MDU4147919.1 helix-turn-helix transcriptional regulator [Bifidobacterium breve]
MKLDNLKILRNENSFRQEDVAAKINVARQTYSYWETGERVPDINSLILLADLYNVSLDYLVGRTSIRSDYRTDPNLDSYIQYCIEGYNKFINK